MAEFPRTVGTLRDQYGNPHQTIVIKRSLSDEVAGVVRAGLQQRHMFDPAGPDRLLVSVVRLDGNEREAPDVVVSFTYRLLDASGLELYVGTSDVHLKGTTRTDGGSFLAYLGRYAYPGLLGYPGVFSSTGSLETFLTRGLTEAVDQALDNQDFRSALEGQKRTAT